MELRQLRNFVTIAELRSFSKAAASLHIAQPALSRQVRKLEEDLGTRLFYRDGRGVNLTESGEKLYTPVKGMLRQLHQIKTEIQASKDVATGEVTLGVPPQLGPTFICSLIRRFQVRCPHAEIRISEGFSYQVSEWLQIGRVDLGLVYDPKPSQDLTLKTLLYEDLYLVGMPSDRAMTSATYNFRDLESLSLIMPDRPSSLRVHVDRAAAETGITCNVVIEVDSIAAIKELVQEGMGYAVMPYAAVFEEVARGTLAAARIINPTVERPLVLALPRTGVLTVAAKELIELIGDEVTALVGQGKWSGALAQP